MTDEMSGKKCTIMNELIEDWNTIEVSTEPTSTIGIVLIEFDLHQHSKKL